MYGTPFTTVPEFYTGWVSWFNGDSTELFPSEPKSKAERFVALMGGSDTVLDEAKIAHAAGDHQFAAELAQLVVRSEPENEDGKLVKAAALRALGYQQLNPIARSWYLTGALELEGAINPALVLGAMTEMLAAEGSTRDTVTGWRYLLDAERAGQTRLTVGIRAADTGEEFTVRLRNSIIVVEDGIATDADATVEATPALLAGMADAPAAVTLSGDTTALGDLMGLLDREMTGFYMHQR
jgi:alkyl sulfatase BDS1-like metallo-beta-lactamase superfamily hydrolase